MSDDKKIEAEHWFTNRQVLALVGFAIMSTYQIVSVKYQFEKNDERYDKRFELIEQKFEQDDAIIKANQERSIKNHEQILINQNNDK